MRIEYSFSKFYLLKHATHKEIARFVQNEKVTVFLGLEGRALQARSDGL